MSYYTLSVQHSGWASSSHPRIRIIGDWLADIGFVSGVLVQALPSPGELTFTVYDKNINYSDLYNETRAKGGTLNRVYIANSLSEKGLTFVTTGKHIGKCGFEFGDILVAKCDFGSIKVRKVSGDVRLVNVARKVDERTGKVMPKIYIFGEWLNAIGFTPDTLVTVAADVGLITFVAYDKEIIYSDIVKFARKNKMRLIQVGIRQGTTFPLINATGVYIKDSGFEVGDIFAVHCEYGIIRLQRFDPLRFGFTDT